MNLYLRIRLFTRDQLVRIAPLFLFAFLITTANECDAEFTKTGEIPLSTTLGNHGLAFDGIKWYIGSPFSDTFGVYDAAFNYMSTSTVAGVADLRGVTYDPNSGHLFVGDQNSGIVYEVTTAGAQLNQFLGPGALNALTYDWRDNSIWLASFSGLIEHRTRAGVLLSSFSKSPNWTGLALDSIHNTLLAMEDNDTVYEYQFNGTLVGHVISSDQVIDNGQGLAYDSSIGRLYASTQFSQAITIFDDPSRVPEPSSLVLASTAFLSLSWRLSRTS